MNYRHAFHAGNFADVFKHLTLSRLLASLKRKPAPFRLIETHAGAGLYDLSSEEAERSGEWRRGIALFDRARMNGGAEDLASPYRAALEDARRLFGASAYPGSPALCCALARPQDRLIFAEAHPDAARELRRFLGADRRARIAALDGWRMLNAAIPPPERRGLALIDPAFESRDEFALIARALPAAWRKWPTGIHALWYPIKDAAIVERFMQAVRDAGAKKTLRAELAVGAVDARGLNACGMLIVNSPWMLDDELNILLPELTRILGRDGAGWSVRWLAQEVGPVPSGFDDASPQRSRRTN